MNKEIETRLQYLATVIKESDLNLLERYKEELLLLQEVPTLEAIVQDEVCHNILEDDFSNGRLVVDLDLTMEEKIEIKEYAYSMFRDVILYEIYNNGIKIGEFILNYEDDTVEKQLNDTTLCNKFNIINHSMSEYRLLKEIYLVEED